VPQHRLSQFLRNLFALDRTRWPTVRRQDKGNAMALATNTDLEIAARHE
jgi:hypothetical protein